MNTFTVSPACPGLELHNGIFSDGSQILGSKKAAFGPLSGSNARKHIDKCLSLDGTQHRNQLFRAAKCSVKFDHTTILGTVKRQTFGDIEGSRGCHQPVTLAVTSLTPRTSHYKKCMSSPTQFSAHVTGHWIQSVLQNVLKRKTEAGEKKNRSRHEKLQLQEQKRRCRSVN